MIFKDSKAQKSEIISKRFKIILRKIQNYSQKDSKNLKWFQKDSKSFKNLVQFQKLSKNSELISKRF